jgi:hypothetical protein
LIDIINNNEILSPDLPDYLPNNTLLCKEGFSDWQHTKERLREHENSFVDRKAICDFSNSYIHIKRIDCQLVLQYIQILHIQIYANNIFNTLLELTIDTLHCMEKEPESLSKIMTENI